MINSNWARWIFASCAKHFKDGAETISFFLEDEEFDYTTLRQWVEFRLTGPDFKEIGQNFWRIDVEINLAINTVVDNVSSGYTNQILQGQFSALFTNIPLYQYGDDDDSLFGCLDLVSDARVMYFGRNPNTRILHSQVEGNYQTQLVGDL